MRKNFLILTSVFILILTALTPPVTKARAQTNYDDLIGLVLSNENGLLNILSEDEYGDDLEWNCLAADAEIFDLLTGLHSYPEEIIEGMYIRVFQSADRPVVWINCWEDGAAAFKAAVSENIQFIGGTCNFLTGDEKYRVTLTSDTIIFDPEDGYVEPSCIQPGQEMFIWVDMVTASCPAQAYPDQVVLIRK